jgi:hypothetical protein
VDARDLFAEGGCKAPSEPPGCEPAILREEGALADDDAFDEADLGGGDDAFDAADLGCGDDAFDAANFGAARAVAADLGFDSAEGADAINNRFWSCSGDALDSAASSAGLKAADFDDMCPTKIICRCVL